MDPINILRGLGTDDVVREGHFVYSSGRHGALYVEKAALYVDTRVISRLCAEMVERFCDEVEAQRLRRRIDLPVCDEIVVVGPALGGIVLSQWFSHHLARRWSRCKVLTVFAEKDKKNEGEFMLSRGYDKLIPGRSAIVVEDVLTTGKSGRKVVGLVRSAGAGNAVGLSALVNRGGVTAAQVGDPSVFVTHTSVRIPDYTADECPLCLEGIPVDPEVGKGAEFLAARALRSSCSV